MSKHNIRGEALAQLLTILSFTELKKIVKWKMSA